ncbi:hypothetical protein [Lysinibacillus sp. JK80]|nr:hypothetical protein [Lysinibacillus sp. JK80]
MNGVIIYGTEEVIERNQTWEVEEYAKAILQLVMIVEEWSF